MGRDSGCKVLFVAVAVVVLMAGFGAVRAEAASPGFTMDQDTLVGTAGDDLLVIGFNGTHWTHNRFALGDPGFASATDFDPGTEGVQSRVFDNPAHTSLAGGNDTLKFVGSIQSGYLIRSAYGGNGVDVIDNSELTILGGDVPRGVTMGSGGEFASNWLLFERFIGTPLNDSLVLDVYDSNPDLTLIETLGGDDSVFGTNRAETIDLGSGANEAEGRGGDDTIVVQSPLGNLAQPKRVLGGDGTDRLRVLGTNGSDVISVVTDYTHFHPRISDDTTPEGGGIKPSTIEAYEIDLAGGDDGLYVEAVAAPISANGGSGDDEMLFNATRFATTQTASSITAHGMGALTHTGFEAAEQFNDWFVVTGTLGGGAPHVRAVDTRGDTTASFYAYAADFPGGVNVATGDLNGDLVDEIITAPGPGGGPHVRVFDRDGADTGIGFYAYDAGFTGGVKVATGDLDEDGLDEIITVPASNGGPHVRVWTGDGELLTEFFAEGFAGTGLTVGTMGTPSGFDQIIIGSGPNTPSRLSTFDIEGEETTTPVSPFGDFRGGVSVTGFQPIDSIGYRHGIAVAAGPGGGPHVRTFLQNSVGSALQPLTSLYAFDPAFTGGVQLGSGVDHHQRQSTLMVGAGRGATPHVRGITAAGQPKSPSYYAYGEAFRGGVNLAVSGARGYFES